LNKEEVSLRLSSLDRMRGPKFYSLDCDCASTAEGRDAEMMLPIHSFVSQ
jgi:hypothetical protein